MNTTIYNQLLNKIVENQFGKTVSQITHHLLIKPQTIFELWKSTQLPHQKLYEALLVLLQHNILLYSDETPITLYIDQNQILFSLNHPHFIALMNRKYGEIGKNIAMTLISYGMLNFDDIYAVMNTKYEDIKENDVKEVFDEMIKGTYIVKVQRNVVDVFQMDKTSNQAPSFTTMKSNEVKKKGKRGKMDTNSVSETKLKKKDESSLKNAQMKKKQSGENLNNLNNNSNDLNVKEEQVENVTEPLWKINITEYNKEVVLFKLLDMVNKKFSDRAVPIIEKMWELSAGGKTPVEFNQLAMNVKEVTPDTIRKYLEIMSRDEPFIVAKNQTAVMTETNSFKLQVDAATAYLKGTMIEKCIECKYGIIGTSIHRVLKIKHCLTDTQIANLLIGDIDEIRPVLFKMHQNGYISGQEIPRSNIRGGKNSYYMWTVNFAQLNAILLNETIKALMNTMERYRMEVSSKADLIAKYHEGEMIGKILFDEEENQEYFDLDRRQNMLLDAQYYLSSLFFCLKDF